MSLYVISKYNKKKGEREEMFYFEDIKIDLLTSRRKSVLLYKIKEN